MKAKKERYLWKRGRKRKMASVRAGTFAAITDRGLSRRLGAIAESVALSFNHEKANRIHKAHKEVHEGKSVPLDSI